MQIILDYSFFISPLYVEYKLECMFMTPENNYVTLLCPFWVRQAMKILLSHVLWCLTFSKSKGRLVF